MKAVVCQNAEFTLTELPEPVPGRGQVLLEVLRCGICGSDLHLRHHCDHMKAMASRVGAGDQFPAAVTRWCSATSFVARYSTMAPAVIVNSKARHPDSRAGSAAQRQSD